MARTDMTPHIIEPTIEQLRIIDLVWESDCQFRKCTGKNPKRVFLSREALKPFGDYNAVLPAPTEIEINSLPVFIDPTLTGVAAYCRR